MKVPREVAVRPEDKLPIPLRELITTVERVPVPMHKCKTLYEAVRVSRGLAWALPIKRFSALCTWATAALLANDASCRLMRQLITSSDVEGESWRTQIGAGVQAAVVELDRLHVNKKVSARDRKRTFQQHKDAATRSLQRARHHLAAIGCKPRLLQLIDPNDHEMLLNSVRDFDWNEDRRHQVRMELARRQLVEEDVPTKHQWAELINRGAFFADDPLPSLDNLLQQAIKIAAEKEVPSIDRHSVRGQFLRSLYSELEGSSISNVRVAFLRHASDAVFSEPIDKAQVRRLIKDIAEGIAARDALLDSVGLGKKWAESFLRKRQEDLSLQHKRSSRSSPQEPIPKQTSRQSRSGSGRCEKVQNESASIKPSRGSRRHPVLRKPAAAEGSLPADRKEPK